MRRGYTLIELVIVVSLLVVILLGGTTIFYRSLRSSGVGNVDLNVTSEMRTLLSSIERDIRFSVVNSVGTSQRSDCLSAGSDGVQGNSLSVTDLQGLTTSYELDTERVASVSAVTNEKVYLTNTNSRITGLTFTWYCQAGVSDKIKIDIDVASAVLGSGLDITRNVERDINLLNSGIN